MQKIGKGDDQNGSQQNFEHAAKQKKVSNNLLVRFCRDYRNAREHAAGICNRSV
jgi:hypothetical protein